MGKPIFDVRKCVVCGCTDAMGCPEGCEWAMADPWLCSSCVPTYFIAKLWGVIFAVERRVKPPGPKLIREIRDLYGRVGKEMAERYGVPTLKQVCQINRNEAKWARHNLDEVAKASAKRPAKRKGR